MVTQTKGLGKGLSALMAEEYSQEVDAAEAAKVMMLPIKDITSGVYQPRHHFDQEALKELADSIRSNGIMQPILVRPLTEKRNGASYEIIAGERRWRASKMAGLTEVPVLIRDIEDKKALEMALIENIQRQDLNALEEAEGYQQLMDGFSYTQEELSMVVGKSRSYIANTLRLLVLPDEVKDYLKKGELSAGHARALLKLDEPAKLAHEVVKRGLNVRQTENLAKAGGLPVKDEEFNNFDALNQNAASPENEVTNPKPSAKPISTKESYSSLSHQMKDPDIIAIEEALQSHLGMVVEINDRNEKGSVAIYYESLAQLDKILKRLGGSL